MVHENKPSLSKIMRKPIIAGNWKMHGTRAEVSDWLNILNAGVKTNTDAQMIIFPPFVFLQECQHLLSNSLIEWGAQNVAAEKNGAFTGEISASMLHEFGCHYTLVGHSERRQLFHDDDKIVAKKFVQAQQSGLQPVLCVGETLQEREENRTLEVVKRQVMSVLDFAGDIAVFKNAVLAYEPVWAIGTGLTATPEQAQEIHHALRHQIAKQDASIADKLRILYGGSVKSSNAKMLFAMPDIDGALVGGASLNPQEFLEIFGISAEN
jgi:triosephosphate isomerase